MVDFLYLPYDLNEFENRRKSKTKKNSEKNHLLYSKQDILYKKFDFRTHT